MQVAFRNYIFDDFLILLHIKVCVKENPLE